MRPLADRMRPVTLDDVVGQKHLIGEGKPLTKMVNSGYICNSVMYGSCGVGKTSIARILAKASGRKFFAINGTSATSKDIQAIIKELDTLEGRNGIVLFIDEADALTKTQIKSVLGYLESQEIILICSCNSMNPYAILGAIISRSMLFEFKPITANEMIEGIAKCITRLNNEGYSIEYEYDAIDCIASSARGDLRKAMNVLDMIVSTSDNRGICIKLEDVLQLVQQDVYMSESKMYDYLSMLHKSIRGSNVDASLLALGALISAGKVEEVLRRILIIGAEDCFATYSSGAMYANLYALVQASKTVGMPECRILLSQAVILLSSAPKSNSAYMAINKVMDDLKTGDIGQVQSHLRDGHYASAEKLGVTGYKYPHDYPNNYVEQEYMTTNRVGVKYYYPGENKFEKAVDDYWKKIK